MADDSPSSGDSWQHVPDRTDDISSTTPSAPSDFLKHLPSSEDKPFADAESSPPPDPTESATGVPSRPQIDSHGRTLNPRSCVTCRRRKVKCDKVHPCNNCTRNHIECVFPAPGRAPRKTRKIGDGRDKELLERLRRLEGVVKGMGVEVPHDEKDSGKDGEKRAGAEAPPSADGAETPKDDIGARDSGANRSYDDLDHAAKVKWVEERQDRKFENRFGRLVVNEGKSRYINNSFWANLSNEVEDLKGILNQSSDEDEPENSPASNLQPRSNNQGWVFGFSSQNVDLLPLHPLPAQIKEYWEIYKDRVDPLVKVLHIPTIESTVLSAASRLSNLSKGFEALLFAIYYGTTTSLNASDCLQKLGEEKSVLLARYRFAMEQSLARANFLTTEEIIILQAFVVFLMCLRRNNDARSIWTLTGLVVRIAQTIGVHRDGSHFGLAPFEIEMRRRLWWQVCILDTRASEDHGCDPTIIEQAFDTKMPLNINDVDITPDMKEFPPERQGCTDMSFCLIRFEVANTFRRINYIPPGPPRACMEYFANVTLQDKEKWITECHNRLEERYLKHCDMSVPLFWVTATVARLMMSKMWLMVYHPFQRHDGGASLPKETKEKLFITSLENIEYSLLLETESRTMKWGWLFKTYMQWHALAFILSELCHRTTGDLVERAWIAVEKTRDGRWGMHITTDSRAGHLWRPLKKLYRKAIEARQRGLQEEALAKPQAKPPQRTYSPNPNSMSQQPKRSTTTRAPLSQPQTKRLSDGPVYGQMPVDKHELFKSPQQGEGGDEGKPESVPAPAPAPSRQLDTTMQQRPPPQQQPPQRAMTDGFAGYTPQQPTMQAPQNYSPVTPNQPQFGQNFFGNQPPINFNDPPKMGPTSAGLASNAPFNPPMPLNSLDSNGWDGPEMDMNMDTSGDMNWENWDQLVQQFGMDVDRAPGASVPTNWVSGNWEMMTNGGSNLRMQMGMGGGDWF